MPSPSGPRHPYQPEPPLERWRSPWSMDDEDLPASTQRRMRDEEEDSPAVTQRIQTVQVPRSKSSTVIQKSAPTVPPAPAVPQPRPASPTAVPKPVVKPAPPASNISPPAESSRSPFLPEREKEPNETQPALPQVQRPSGKPVPTLPVREISSPLPTEASPNEYRPGYSPPLSGRIPTRLEPKRVKPVVKKEKDDFEDIRRAVRGPDLAPMRGVVFLGVGVLLFMVLAWGYLMDGRPPDDEDLLTSSAAPVAQTAEPRAAGLLAELLQNLPPLEEKVMNVWRWETPTLGRVSSQYLRSFDSLQQLLLESEWQPHHPIWRDAQLGTLSSQWSVLTDSCAVRAAYHMRRAEEDEALLAALELTQLSGRLAAIGSNPGYILQSLNLQDQATSILAEVLRSSTRLDAAALAAAQAQFAQHEVTGQIMREQLNQLYLYERRFIVGPLPHEPMDALTESMLHIRPGRLFFKPHHTLRIFTDSFRDLKQNVMAPVYQQRQESYLQLGSAGAPNTAWGAPNCKGIGYANERVWSYVELVNHFYRQQAKHRLVLIFFALKRFTVDRGNPPVALTELLPLHLSALPADPYSPHPFSYDLGKGVLYSAGTDFSPAGGNKEKSALSDPSEPTIILR